MSRVLRVAEKTAPSRTKAAAAAAAAAAAVEEIAGEGFDVARFVENFDVIAEAAGGTKQLRELVLHLAVSGRLFTNPHKRDALPTAELEIGRSRLKAIGLKVAAPSPVAEEDVPYPVPPNWRWVRLRDLGSFLGGGTPSKSKAEFWEGPIPWVSPKDMKRLLIDDAEDHISEGAIAGSAAKLIPAGSLLCVLRGMILAHSFPVALTTREVTINQDMKALVFGVPEFAPFVLLCCRAAKRRVLAMIERSSHGTCRLDAERLETLPIALPPLAEQKRIVAKVDQLMALCDELEAKQTKKRETSARLTKSALEALTTAEGPAEFDAAWRRVVENFDVLIDRAEKVGELRRAVLGLAIRGRLEEQQECDESASELLSRILARRGLKRTAVESEPFRLPQGWCWARFPELGSFGRGKSKHRPRNDPKLFENGKYPMVQTGDVARANGEISTYTALYGEAGLAQSRLWPKGSLCITIAANIADSGLLGFDACFPDSVVGFVPDHEFASAAYFEFFLRTAKQSIEAFAPATAQKNINLEILGAVLVPLPPKCEMIRIVAKVENLMKACDRLEEHLRQAEARASKLADASVQSTSA